MRRRLRFSAAWATGVTVVLFGVLFGVFDGSVAEAAAKKSTMASGFAVVVAEAAQIYAEPDLDAPVVAVVRRGTRLPVSKGTRGEFAKFHRTRINGKIGWIVTLDLKSEAEAKKFLTQAKAAEYKPGPFAEEAEAERNAEKSNESGREKEPYAFTKSVSFVIGMNDYKESINGVDHSSNLIVYGVKLTGPDVFLSGPLMDVNVLFHYGAPDHYNALSSTKPTGFVLWTDANLLLPIRVRQDSLIGLGVGPVLVLSNIQASQGAQSYSMWELNAGADVELSAGIRFGDFSFRVEGKYIFEKKTYRQVQVAIGTVF